MTRLTIVAITIAVLTACTSETTSVTETSSTAVTPAVETETGSTATAPEAGLGTGGCALITEADATSVMGHPMKFGRSSATECNLISASDDLTKSIAFQIFPDTSTYDAMAGAAGQKPVPGVGEKAVAADVGNTVAAVKGGRTYLGGVYDASAPDKARDKSIELAKKVVARM